MWKYKKQVPLGNGIMDCFLVYILFWFEVFCFIFCNAHILAFLCVFFHYHLFSSIPSSTSPHLFPPCVLLLLWELKKTNKLTTKSFKFLGVPYCPTSVSFWPHSTILFPTSCYLMPSYLLAISWARSYLLFLLPRIPSSG